MFPVKVEPLKRYACGLFSNLKNIYLPIFIDYEGLLMSNEAFVIYFDEVESKDRLFYFLFGGCGI